MKFKHEPVLLKQCIEGLKINPDGVYVDGTLGGAGHSNSILKNLSSKGKLIGIDRDDAALDFAIEKLKDYSNVEFVKDNHDNIKNILERLNIELVDGILLDLGVSSHQIDEFSRGFSYTKNSILDMRMDTSNGISAKEVINTYEEERLANIIFEYGEEKFSRQIAKRICEIRKQKEITTTLELADIVEKSVPSFVKKQGHPAKRTFQAIRIEVNNEIEPLYNTIIDSIKALKNGGRLCVITFHSLEDRAVKNAYVEATGKCRCPKEIPYCICNPLKLGNIITKKPIEPDKDEIEENPRSKSAKLRIFERMKD